MRSIHSILSLVLMVASVGGCAGPHTAAPSNPSTARVDSTPGLVAHFDPASQDRPVFDVDHPPMLVDTQFVVEGARMNAIIYEAQGAGPHPTVVLLHGFPGYEKNLDVAQAMRRAGWNVVFFHYRGAWGSGGSFSFSNILEDVAGVVNAISQPELAAKHRIDPRRLALVGHSMGGFAALISGAELPAIDCVVSMAGANLGGVARSLMSQPADAARFAGLLDSWSGPIRGPKGQELIDEISRNADRFDTTLAAPALAKKNVLLIAGEIDTVTPVTQSHMPLVEALKREGAGSLTEMTLVAADHSFSGQRIVLAREVSRWLVESCEAGG